MVEPCVFCATKPAVGGGECDCVIGRQFVKLINAHSSKSLRFPLRFANYAQETGMMKCRLIGPLKHRWEVQLLKDDEGCSFGDGWESFYKAHKLEPGCTLTFEYVGKASFKVTVFDALAGESMYGMFTYKAKEEQEMTVDSSDLVNGMEGNTGQAGPRQAIGRETNVDASPPSKKAGRLRNPRPDWKDEKKINLKGIFLSDMNVFRLKKELDRRSLSTKGFKADLVERLGEYIEQKRTAARSFQP